MKKTIFLSFCLLLIASFSFASHPARAVMKEKPVIDDTSPQLQSVATVVISQVADFQTFYRDVPDSPDVFMQEKDSKLGKNYGNVMGALKKEAVPEGLDDRYTVSSDSNIPAFNLNNSAVVMIRPSDSALIFGITENLQEVPTNDTGQVNTNDDTGQNFLETAADNPQKNMGSPAG